MFNPSLIVIDHFVELVVTTFTKAFPQAETAQVGVLEQSTRMALETLNNSDCAYHDMDHTVMVTDVGQTILWGRQMSQGDVTADDWLHAVLAMLHHDIGFVRGILRGDRGSRYVVNEHGDTITPPPGATDAYMAPYHVTRGCLFVRERFSNEPVIDAQTIIQHIEMTRFPVPADPFYQRVADYGGLVRAADLIGQMADPLYIQKLPKLYAEFVEIGEASRLGYENAGDIRSLYPNFFYSKVRPYISEGLRFLRKTQQGQLWVASLFNHLYSEEQHEPSYGPERRRNNDPACNQRRRASDGAAASLVLGEDA
jgi:hypothetical protein